MNTLAVPYGFEGLDDLDTAEVLQAPKTFLNAQFEAAAKPTAKCYACRGSGKFYSRFGRLVGDCFKCSGSGSISQRAAKMHATKQANEQTAIETRAIWCNEHSDVLSWINANNARNDFAASLARQFASRGSLTDNQVAAVRECLAKAARRLEEQRAAVVNASPSVVGGLDLSKLPEGFYAVPNGDTRLKVRVKKPAAPSRWANFIFVSDGAAYGQARNYGRQAPGKAYTGDIVPQLTIIAADPLAASQAYGKLTSRCGVCGRHLEDAESVAFGIGPVCRAKFAQSI